MATKIIVPEGYAPVFRKVDRGFETETAYVELHLEEKVLTAGTTKETKFFFFLNERVLRWRIPSNISRKSLIKLLEEIKPYAEQVILGYDFEWNGERFAGLLTHNAQKSIDKISELCDLENQNCFSLTVCHYDDWLCGFELEEIWPAGKTFDEVIFCLYEMAEKKDTVLYGSIEDALLNKLGECLYKGKKTTYEQKEFYKKHRPIDAMFLYRNNDNNFKE